LLFYIMGTPDSQVLGSPICRFYLLSGIIDPLKYHGSESNVSLRWKRQYHRFGESPTLKHPRLSTFDSDNPVVLFVSSFLNYRGRRFRHGAISSAKFEYCSPVRTL